LRTNQLQFDFQGCRQRVGTVEAFAQAEGIPEVSRLPDPSRPVSDRAMEADAILQNVEALLAVRCAPNSVTATATLCAAEAASRPDLRERRSSVAGSRTPTLC